MSPYTNFHAPRTSLSGRIQKSGLFIIIYYLALALPGVGNIWTFWPLTTRVACIVTMKLNHKEIFRTTLKHTTVGTSLGPLKYHVQHPNIFASKFWIKNLTTGMLILYKILRNVKLVNMFCQLFYNWQIQWEVLFHISKYCSHKQEQAKNHDGI